jgi:hypothetical protein
MKRLLSLDLSSREGCRGKWGFGRERTSPDSQAQSNGGTTSTSPATRTPITGGGVAGWGVMVGCPFECGGPHVSRVVGFQARGLQ